MLPVAAILHDVSFFSSLAVACQRRVVTQLLTARVKNNCCVRVEKMLDFVTPKVGPKSDPKNGVAKWTQNGVRERNCHVDLKDRGLFLGIWAPLRPHFWGRKTDPLLGSRMSLIFHFFQLFFRQSVTRVDLTK